MQITRADVFWNYGATFIKIAASALLLPFILNMMPPETVGIWSVFMTVTAFTGLLDFGFGPSFTRNITYIFSGVKSLKVNGYETVDNKDITVNYGLLKGVIKAMRWFYFRISIALFILLATIGTYYIYTILENYNGNRSEIFIAWSLLIGINTYNLFTLYYDALLQGKGLIKRSKQIIIAGQSVYLIMAASLILAGYGLVAIVAAQASSVIIIRWLSHRTFFTRELKQEMHRVTAQSEKDIIKTIFPNAVKIGLTSLGGFMVQRSSIVIGSLYLSLEDIASYGITMQIIAIISGISGIYIATYQPKIAQLRVLNNVPAIKDLYLKGQVILFATFVFFGTGLVLLGDWALRIIGSQTLLMNNHLLVLAIIISLLETNLSTAGNILLTRNTVPFLKASLISGGVIITGLLLGFRFAHGSLLILLVVPLIVDVAYQAWKWPLEVIKDLNIAIRLTRKQVGT
jgi:O-antigen/teichoic acid export membrane protein